MEEELGRFLKDDNDIIIQTVPVELSVPPTDFVTHDWERVVAHYKLWYERVSARGMVPYPPTMYVVMYARGLAHRGVKSRTAQEWLERLDKFYSPRTGNKIWCAIDRQLTWAKERDKEVAKRIRETREERAREFE